MGRFFKITELTYSATAKKYGIDNTPTEAEIQHMEELIEFIDDVREKWGSALLVSSGYRSEELNFKVGGAKTSAHRTGYAVDIVPANNQKENFYEFMQEYLKDKDFDELIFETNSQGGSWIHFALKSVQGKQRRKIKNLKVK